MKDLAEMLEEELSEAVEVKNPKSLHRYIALLTGTHVEKSIHNQRYNELTGSIKEILISMHEGFRRMDEHFAAQDRRFESLQKQIDIRFDATQKQMDERFAATNLRFEDMNKRFDDMNRRFDKQHKLISIGFTAMTLIIAAFNLAVILG